MQISLKLSARRWYNALQQQPMLHLFLGDSMKLSLFAFLLLATASVANASSGQWNRENLALAEEVAYVLEKRESKADDVQIMDSYMKNGVAYVTVGPEWGGRAARIYNCWQVRFSEGDLIRSTSRVQGEVCRQL